MRSDTSISRAMTLLLACATGVVVANLYYAQPLLHTIARQFGVGEAAAGLVVTASQLGYAAGLLLLVPVGDVVSRRGLVPIVLLAGTGVLLAMALAPGLPALVGAAGAVGVTSVVVQILVPLAAELAPEAERGRVVGRVMSGLLLGILLSRTIAGFVADWIGWRGLYGLAAVLSVLLAAVLRRTLPADPERPRLAYGALLRSIGGLARREPRLLRHAAYGALGFAAFSTFWTPAAFLLAGPHYRYGDATIGLFGLVGAAGALTASAAGRLADVGRGRVATVAFGGGIALAFVLLGAGARSLAALIAGIVLLDVAVQGLHVLNISEVYRLAPQARSRANSLYMTTYFVGGATGSAVSTALYETAGWAGVVAFGAATGAGIVGLWLATHRPEVPASAPASEEWIEERSGATAA
jgi:predicted MFS family arabinose efflux permease